MRRRIRRSLAAESNLNSFIYGGLIMETKKPVYQSETGDWDVFKDNEGYKFSNGESIDTVEDTLDNIVYIGLDKIEMFFEIIFDLSQSSEDKQLERIAHVGLTLVNDMQNQIEECDGFTTKKCGQIVIDRATPGQLNIRDNAMLAARFIESELT